MGLLLSGKNPAAYKTAERTTFTATAGQTTFTVPVGYNIGDIDVYLNGIRLIEADDYYATNGTTVILTTAASAGDSLVVVCYYNFLNSSSYTKAEGDARYVGFGSTTPMTTYLRTPNYGVSSYSDSASASLEANPGLGTQGVGIKASGRSVATTGGEITYISDTRGASGAHRFYGWNGTSLTNFGGFDSSGRHTKPLQPYFKYGANSRDITTAVRFGTDWGWTINTDRDSIDSPHFNKANGRFTCPVAGVYLFGVTTMRNGTSQNGPLDYQIVKNETTVIGQTSGSTYGRAYQAGYASAYEQHTIVVPIKCNIGDFVCLDFTGTMSWYNDDSWFYGYLLG